MSPDGINLVGMKLLNKPVNNSSGRFFKGNFGTGCLVVSFLWFLLHRHNLIAKDCKVQDLLIGLHRLYTYCTDNQGSVFANCHPNTYRPLVKKIIFAIAGLAPYLFKIENRHKFATGEKYRMTTDGVDFLLF